jgi:ADP-ribose pyrophosphatase YjhB (NUDIX family)
MARSTKDTLPALLEEGTSLYLPSISVDCVIFGFHDSTLKVLLLKGTHTNKWALPGGFVRQEEDVEKAAVRVLQERTQLKGIFLQQFHLFGEAKRTRQKHARKLLEGIGVKNVDDHWMMQRFVTLGYYALVEYEKVAPVPDALSSDCTWHPITDLPSLIIDHAAIIDRGLETLRRELNYQPIGYNLLPEAFPLKDLQVIYETILGRSLDRANFQRKILSYGILDKREKLYNGGSHKAPYLYSFNRERYFEALKNGLAKEW